MSNNRTFMTQDWKLTPRDTVHARILSLPLIGLSAAVALLLRERRRRLTMERLGAATLETLLDAIDANNPVTGAHVRRVANYSLILADAAGLDEHVCRSIERVALFHDIGKIDGALTDIVEDASSLTPEEWSAIQTHPRCGADVLQPLDAFYPDLGKGVLSHHERWDGNGYPRKLSGRRIPLSARVVMIADTFDAITAARSYDEARSLKTATEAIAAGRGSQFDPDFTDLFLSPPVLEEVAAAMKKAHDPRRAKGKGRRSGSSDYAPDITFRWRKAARRPQPAGR